MKRWNSGQTGVDQGDVQLFADYVDDGPMWTGSGEREIRREVKFSGKFRSPPAVHVSLSLLDLDQSTNTRVEIVAEDVTNQGFDLVFRTWGDTRIARVRAAWFAIGDMRNHDDWDID
jgi:hypothetical protein